MHPQFAYYSSVPAENDSWCSLRLTHTKHTICRGQDSRRETIDRRKAFGPGAEHLPMGKNCVLAGRKRHPVSGGGSPSASKVRVRLSRAAEALLARIMRRAEKMQRDVWCITHHPTIVTGRSMWNVEERAGAEFVDGAVIHRRSGTARENQTDVLDVAARSAYAGPDMNGPFPSWLVRGAADGHAPDANEFEFSFLEGLYLVGLFETFQNRFQRRHISVRRSSNPGYTGLAVLLGLIRIWALRPSSRGIASTVP